MGNLPGFPARPDSALPFWVLHASQTPFSRGSASGAELCPSSGPPACTRSGSDPDFGSQAYWGEPDWAPGTACKDRAETTLVHLALLTRESLQVVKQGGAPAGQLLDGCLAGWGAWFLALFATFFAVNVIFRDMCKSMKFQFHCSSGFVLPLPSWYTYSFFKVYFSYLPVKTWPCMPILLLFLFLYQYCNWYSSPLRF